MRELRAGELPGSAWGWGVAKFDYYSATVRGVEFDDVVRALMARLARDGVELLGFSPCRGKNGYLRGVKLHRGERVFAEVWAGGNPDVHIQTKGQDARVVVPALRACFPAHAVARADVCFDWVSPGLFDVMASEAERFGLARELSLRHEGDWARKQGRTLYVGSSKSAAYLCLYEKGYREGGSASRDWVRLELRVQPHSTRKEACAAWTEEEFLGASRWVVELLSSLAVSTPAPLGVGRAWRNRDAERARAWFLRQGKGVIREWVEECGGSPEVWGLEVVKALEVLERDGVVPEVGELVT